MGAGKVTVGRGVCVLFAVVSVGTVAPKASTAPYEPVFYGMVYIEGQPADLGTVVQVAVFRTGQTYTVCSDTTVQLLNTGLPGIQGQVAAYMARLSPTPQCLNPDNVYEFYVNGVYAS